MLTVPLLRLKIEKAFLLEGGGYNRAALSHLCFEARCTAGLIQMSFNQDETLILKIKKTIRPLHAPKNKRELFAPFLHRILFGCLPLKLRKNEQRVLFPRIYPFLEVFPNLEEGKFFGRHLNDSAGLGISARVSIVFPNDKASKASYFYSISLLQFFAKALKNEIDRIGCLLFRETFLLAQRRYQFRLVHTAPYSRIDFKLKITIPGNYQANAALSTDQR